MERKLTLHGVREILSPKVFENPNWKGLAYFARDIVVFAFIMVGLWYAESWFLIVPLWLLAGLSISSLFIIGHDAAHGALFQNQRLSWWVGQLGMLPSLHAFTQWSYGHNRVHHGHTINLDGDFVWHPLSPKEYSKLSWAGKLFHRLNWSMLGAGTYYMFEIWLRGMMIYTAPIKNALRDKLIVIGFGLGVSALAFFFGASTASGFSAAAGVWAWVKMVGVPFFAWNYVVGFAVYVHHIHDTIPWKQRPEWSPFYGQMQGTVNYHIPALANFFMHDIFIHNPHHVSMRIPFYRLNDALQEIKAVYPEYVVERKSTIADYISATRKCKLFDTDSGKWLTYAQAAAAVATSEIDPGEMPATEPA